MSSEIIRKSCDNIIFTKYSCDSLPMNFLLLQNNQILTNKEGKLLSGSDKLISL